MSAQLLLTNKALNAVATNINVDEFRKEGGRAAFRLLINMGTIVGNNNHNIYGRKLSIHRNLLWGIEQIFQTKDFTELSDIFPYIDGIKDLSNFRNDMGRSRSRYHPAPDTR